MEGWLSSSHEKRGHGARGPKGHVPNRLKRHGIHVGTGAPWSRDPVAAAGGWDRNKDDFVFNERAPSPLPPPTPVTFIFCSPAAVGTELFLPPSGRKSQFPQSGLREGGE